MSLGKTRSMRRTISLTEFAADVVLADVVETMQPTQEQEKIESFLHHQRNPPALPEGRAVDWLEARYQGGSPMMMPPSPLGGRRRRKSADLGAAEQTAPFLRACGLCKRRLGPGRDTFMYRGDMAFCSLECRQQHINQEERKENCLLTSIKDIPQAAAAPEQPGGDAEMIAAA